MDLSNRPALPHLKGRPLECMLLAREGLTAKQIARRLNISHRTVETHVATAIEALGVPNRVAAIARICQLEAEGCLDLREKPILYLCSGPASDNLASAEELGPAWKAQNFPPLGKVENLAPEGQRVVWIARITGLCIMIGCAIILTILGVVEIAGGFDQ